MKNVTVTIKEMIASAEYELIVRQGCFPSFVVAGQMTQDKANHEIYCQMAIVELLKRMSPTLESKLVVTQ